MMTIQQSRNPEQSEHGALNEAEYWNAIDNRNKQYDGVFWFGLRTTGIYCRPSCPSRQPNQENVEYFATPDAARRSNYRACLRCHPDEIAFVDPQAELVQSICRLLDESIVENPDLAFLSQKVGVSQSHLQRIFKKLMGISPRQYVEARRADIFKAGVKEGQSVTDAIYDAGYGSSSRLYEKAAAQLGMTPATYGKGGKGTKITYTIVECHLGMLLVAATKRGICSVMLGDEIGNLTSDLYHEFPQAEIGRDDDHLRSQVKTLLDFFAGKTPRADLPLYVQGTAFQMWVWDKLRRILYIRKSHTTEHPITFVARKSENNQPK